MLTCGFTLEEQGGRPQGSKEKPVQIEGEPGEAQGEQSWREKAAPQALIRT